MSLLNRTVSTVNRLLTPFDAGIVRPSEVERFRDVCVPLPDPLDEQALPPGAATYLRGDHPRLEELRARYRQALPADLASSRWTDEYKARTIDLRFFRSQNSYVFSDLNWEFKYALTAYYTRVMDGLHLLDVLTEDGLYGCPTVTVEGRRRVSRDLLDSVLELYFLERTFGLASRRDAGVLDIGAGYGRFAYRLASAFPDVRTICTDAVPESTFLCEYYLRQRGVDDRARVAPFDELQTALGAGRVDLAVNIHSFSECTLTAVTWWADLLQRHDVRYLMIVPNAQDHGGTRLLTQEREGPRRDFQPMLESRGYRLVDRSPKYADPIVQKYGISPTHHFLFERRP